MLFESRLRARLQTSQPSVHAEWEARPAAVLVPLYREAGAWHVLYTRRTDHLPSHKGQVAFPGGRVEAADRDRVDTALREAEEELGLRRADVRVLGQLNELLTVTQYRVTPVVGVIPWPYPLTPSADEINAVFGVPLRWLADPNHVHTRLREPIVPGAPPVAVYHFFYNGFDIWGATARMTLNLLDMARDLLTLEAHHED